MRKTIVLLFIGIITSWSCFEGDPLHDITGERLQNGRIFRDTLYAINSTSIVEGKVPTGLSTKLLLGSYKEFETRILIQFGSIPHDSIKVDSLRLILTALENQGDIFGSIQGSAHLVTNYWPESVNEDEDWDWRSNIDYSPEYSSQFEIGEETSIYQSVDLPPAMMDVWQDTVGGSKNFGLLLDYHHAGYIKQFSSVDALFSGQRPRLAYVWYDETQDSTHHDTLFVSKDASLIDFTGSFDPEKLYVSSGYSVRSFFEFDFSEIPQTAALSTMNFVAKRDTLNSVKNNLSLETMYFRTVTTPFDDLPSYKVDSTFVFNFFYSLRVGESSENVLEIETREQGTGSQNFMQGILNGDIDYGSFLLHYKYEGEDISVYSIKDNKTPLIDDWPILILEYYDIPQPRM